MQSPWDALVAHLGFVPVVLLFALLVGAAFYFDLRAWWRTWRNRMVLSCLTPRCIECACVIRVLEPLTPKAVQQVRCDSCGVHLHCKRIGGLWEICTVAEAKRQRTAPLPPVASARRRYDLLGFLRTVLSVVRPGEGVSPGESAFPQLAAPEGEAVAPQARPVEVSLAVVHGARSGQGSPDGITGQGVAATGKRAPELA
jgi:hypothetical protein